MQQKTYRHIVFDWDGTLVDSMHYKIKNFVGVFMEIGIGCEIDLVRQHETFTGLPRQLLFSNTFLALTGNELKAELFNELSNKYTVRNQHDSLGLELFADAAEFLAVWTKSERKFSISSSAHPDEVHGSATRLLQGYPPLCALGSEGAFHKGIPHISFICEKFSLSKSEILFVGDDLHDGTLADAAGVDFIRIVRGGPRARDANVVTSLMDLFALCASTPVDA
jgi:phosphoglycolate phosphatase-like HAD superfamily hydrolase